MRKAAEAQIALANARGESVKMMEEELRKLRSGITSADEYGRKVKEVAGTTRGATKDMAGGWGQVSAATQQATQAAQEHQRQMAQKYGRAGQSESLSTLERGWAKDEKGNTIGQTKHNWLSIYNMVKSMGVSDAQAREIADKAYDSQGRYTGQLQREQMRSSYDSIDITEAARRAAEQIIRAGSGGGVNGAASGSAAAGGVAGARTTGTQPGGVATFVSNITIDGVMHKVNTADKESQQALEGLLRELAAGKASAA